MNKRILLLISVINLLLACSAFAQNVDIMQMSCDIVVAGKISTNSASRIYDDTIKELCTIRNVKKAKGFNVIFAKVKSNDYLIVILSKSHYKRKNIVDKIECGKDYNFVLHPLYNFSEKYFPMIVDVKKYKIMGKTLRIKGSHYVYEIYTSPNLIGLYYCSEKNE
ncbi:MAG: hypothetical protein J5709_10320 [Bacteroidales bacterium]|nr:hypothetical protein [Bacteroidales bacterium]